MEEKIKEIWDQVLTQLVQKYDITEAAANTWIRPLQVYKVSDGKITFLMDKKYDKRGVEFIKHRFYDLSIGLAIQDLIGVEYTIDICLSDEVKIEEAPAPTIVEVEEPKKEEEVVEVTPIQKKEAPKGNVRVRLNKNHHCFIGGEYYNFTKGNCYLVPENVKCILNKAGLLAPL